MTQNCGCVEKSYYYKRASRYLTIKQIHKLVGKAVFNTISCSDMDKILLLVSKCSKMRKHKTLMDELQYKSDRYYTNILYANICNYTKDLFGDHALNCHCISIWISNCTYNRMLNQLQNHNLPIRQHHIDRVNLQLVNLQLVKKPWDCSFFSRSHDTIKIASLLIAKSGLTDQMTNLPLKSLQTVAYDLTYKRMIEICLAMQDIDLPALVTYKIVKHACRFLCPGAKAKMNDVWRIITKIKHFH
jgi:hypothetical protein